MKKPVTNPRPGFVLEVDRQTPAILFHHGEGFRMEKLPVGRSRVIYPGEPLNGLDDPDGEIRHALLHPIDDDPLPSLFAAGHEADHRLRRHLAAPTADAATRRPPADHRGGPRPGGRSGCRRRAI